MTSKERHQARYIRRREKRLTKRLEQNKKYDNFDILVNPVNLYNAFLECKKPVSWKYSMQHFQLHLLENIYTIIESLNKGIAPAQGFVCFTINERGKTRYIRSPHVMERVVQKCLCNNILIPILTKTLIYDNSASLKDKGTDFARRRIVKHFYNYWKNNGLEGYVLVIDFSKYFDNINHEKLIKMVKVYIHDKRIINILTQLIDEFGEKGLGLGSQISQILAVFYPNFLDHLIKNTWNQKYYARYMDDSYIINKDKEKLEELITVIADVLAPYDIKLNSKKTRIIKLKNGIPFLHTKYNITNTGYVLKRGGKESAKRTRHKIKYFANELKQNRIDINYVLQWYKSWRGFMLGFDSSNCLNYTDNFFNRFIGVNYGVSFYYKRQNGRALCG